MGRRKQQHHVRQDPDLPKQPLSFKHKLDKLDCMLAPNGLPYYRLPPGPWRYQDPNLTEEQADLVLKREEEEYILECNRRQEAAYRDLFAFLDANRDQEK